MFSGVICLAVLLLYPVKWFLIFKGPSSSFPSPHPIHHTHPLKGGDRCPFFHAPQLQLDTFSLIPGNRCGVILISLGMRGIREGSQF